MISWVVSNVIIQYRYGITSGTKHFVEHTDLCFPFISSDPVSGDTHDSQLAHFKLNQVDHSRPFSIVEDYGFEHLASIFIKIGMKITLTTISEHTYFL